MKKLTKKQEAKRDEFTAEQIKSGRQTKESIERMMSDPILRSAINALFASE